MSILLVEEQTPLQKRLASVIQGEVRFDKGDLSLYATDASNYRYIPIGVVIPKDKTDIIQTIRICSEMSIPVVSRGGGTSLAGQTTNEAVVIDMSKYYHHVVEISPEEKWARVQPGIILDALNDKVGEHGLIVGPDPATHAQCTIGGMLGNNACGVHAQWAGKMQENILELEVVTYEGEVFTVGETSAEELEAILARKDKKAHIYHQLLKLRNNYQDQIRQKYPDIPRRVSGYNLEELLPEKNFNIARALIGSESTLVTVLEAKIKLLEKPKCRVLLVAGYPKIDVAGDDIKELVKFEPMGLEAVDELLKLYVEEKKIHPEGIQILPEGDAFLFLEFGAQSTEAAEKKARECLKSIQKRTEQPDENFKLITDEEEQEKLWKVRESGLAATSRGIKTDANWPGWEDAAVPPEKVGPYLRDFQGLLKAYGYKGALYGHFGQGCIHSRISFDLKTHEGVQNYHKFIKEAARLVVKYGGSLSGEHGDGQARGELLEEMYGSIVVEAMEEFKRIWDPKNLMNPGKIVYPNSAIDHLRLGEQHKVHLPKTHFSFVEDDGSFELATERCVGVGKCRQLEGSTMCPSFQVTHEEKHTTRGRAHLLFEMLKQDTLLKPWKEEAVKESLDLCLACKGCKSDCPVSVDMATYKAEFLSHYYKKKKRPIAAYTMGMIFYWNRIASKMPWLVNFITHVPPFSWIFKSLGGMTQKRSVPKYASRTFRADFENEKGRKDHSSTAERGEVILWVDSFNNYFHPDVLKAVSESLEFCGYKIKLPPKNLCCGRPLYDFGFLKMAKRFLNDIMTKLEDDINKGTPIIIAEPSCLSVFTDELVNLFPNNLTAKRLKDQTFTLTQFLDKQGLELDLPKLDGQKIQIHGHCHHKSLNSMEPDVNILGKIADAEMMQTGCCGMAGAFGFEEGEKYEVSVKVGEHDLIPKVRAADENTMIIADGFSCREQVKGMAGFYPKHSAHVVQEAIARKQAQETQMKQ